VRRYLFLVDSISAAVGKLFGWCIVGLTVVVGYDVLMRYAFRAPTAWAFDAAYMLYGTLFMMAGAYTLSRNGHVRGDMFYREWPVRRQAAVDLLLYCLFFLPGILALVWSGWTYAETARLVNERSFSSPGGPIIWPFKFIIPLAGALLLLQGIVEIVRCVICIRQGEWPSRQQDVEEVDVDKLKEMVHVKDADIEALDKHVLPPAQRQEGA
jgi:TRAP-type mannitol/chloroaromatic compound transport system permease small subunit